MTRVRSLSPDSDQSDELNRGEPRKDTLPTPTTGHVTSHMTTEPRYDSPKLVRMEMSDLPAAKDDTLKDSSLKPWVDEEIETRTCDSIHTASVQFSTTVSMSYEPSMTITSDSSEAPQPSAQRQNQPEQVHNQPTTWYSDQVPDPAYRPAPSPVTPMSQHTHSDLAAFQYPVEDPGYSKRPDTGQQVNQANPRSSNYKPVSSYGQNGADIRRTHTFSNGRDSGWSQRQEPPRATNSPSDDSLPNSPTYFIHNNPNDDRDTPSPATQANNESFQNHLQQLEGRGSRKLRVLNWMQQTSTESNWPERERGMAAMRRDLATSAPMIPYQKQAPVYASIDDPEDSQLRPGSGRHTAMADQRLDHMTGPVDHLTRPHTRTGSGDQRFPGGDLMSRPKDHVTRPHTRTGDHVTRRPGSGDRHMTAPADHMMTRPGGMTRPAGGPVSGGRASQPPRGYEPRQVSAGMRPNTRQPANQIGVSQASNQMAGASRRAHTFSQGGRGTGGAQGRGYPTSKYPGNYYVIDV